MKTFKIESRIIDNGKVTMHHGLFIKADNEIEAEHKAKFYWIMERPEVDFINIHSVKELPN